MAERQSFEFAGGYVFDVVPLDEKPYKKFVGFSLAVMSRIAIRPIVTYDPELSMQLEGNEQQIVVASSHHTYLDIPILAQVILMELGLNPGGIVAKSSLTRGIAGAILKPTSFMIPAPRRSRREMSEEEQVFANRIRPACIAVLQSMDLVVFVPGRTVDDPYDLGETLPGAYECALEAGALILPAGISGAKGSYTGPGKDLGARGLIRPVSVHCGELINPRDHSKEDVDLAVSNCLDIAGFNSGRMQARAQKQGVR